MSNRRKPPKPTTNLFQTTTSQKNKHNNYLLALPESKHYRKQLEPLLGAVVNIETDRFTLISDMVDGKPCHRILLENADVVKCPVNRNIKIPVHIQHIWTAFCICMTTMAKRTSGFKHFQSVLCRKIYLTTITNCRNHQKQAL